MAGWYPKSPRTKRDDLISPLFVRTYTNHSFITIHRSVTSCNTKEYFHDQLVNDWKNIEFNINIK